MDNFSISRWVHPLLHPRVCITQKTLVFAFPVLFHCNCMSSTCNQKKIVCCLWKKIRRKVIKNYMTVFQYQKPRRERYCATQQQQQHKQWKERKKESQLYLCPPKCSIRFYPTPKNHRKRREKTKIMLLFMCLRILWI